jgi:hypothetical protein
MELCQELKSRRVLTCFNMSKKKNPTLSEIPKSKLVVSEHG